MFSKHFITPTKALTQNFTLKDLKYDFKCFNVKFYVSALVGVIKRFENMSIIIQVPLKSDKNNGYFT